MRANRQSRRAKRRKLSFLLPVLTVAALLTAGAAVGIWWGALFGTAREVSAADTVAVSSDAVTSGDAVTSNDAVIPGDVIYAGVIGTDRLAPPSSTTRPEELKWIALTFDDGPDSKYTPKVLDILKEHDVKATFFLVGKQVKAYPKVAKRIVDEGHTVGNHSWSHQKLTGLKPAALQEQVKLAQKEIAAATGVEPALMRAPYGALSDGVLDCLGDLQLQHVMWTIDPKDWNGTSVAEMRKNIMKHARPGGIILLHSFGGRKDALDHTLQLLPLIIGDLRKEGYEFATVDRMIEEKAVVASAIK